MDKGKGKAPIQSEEFTTQSVSSTASSSPSRFFEHSFPPIPSVIPPPPFIESKLSAFPDFPSMNVGHRRAPLEFVTTAHEEHGSAGGSNGNGAAEEDVVSMFFDMDKYNSSSASLGDEVGPENVELGDGSGADGADERHRIRHNRSQTVDVPKSAAIVSVVSPVESIFPSEGRRAKPVNLAEIALTDPRRARR